MRNAQVAEWILSLVTTPERAAATVGDLMENSAIGGALRFWIGVLRTAVSMLWREFSDDPARMMGLAIRGLLVQFGFFFGIVLAFVMGGGLLGFLAGLFWDPTKVAFGPYPWAHAIGLILGAGFGIFVPFLVGRWLAWKSPGCELAPVVAFTILGFVISTVAELIWDRQESLSQFILGLGPGLAWNALLEVPTLAGAVWERRKRMTR